MLDSPEPEKLKEVTELVETSEVVGGKEALIVTEQIQAEKLAADKTGPENQEPEKIDEVFLQYWKRIFAFVIDYFVSGISTLGAGFFLPIMMLGFDFLWTGWDASPGKKYLSLRVRDSYGNELSERRAFARVLLKWTTLTIVFFGYANTHSPLWLLLLITYKRRTIYDWLAGTCVMGKAVDMRTAFSPRPNYFLFVALVALVISFSYLRFSIGHKFLSMVEPLLPGLLQPARQTLAAIELNTIHLDPYRTVDFSRIDRMADLQQIVEPSGSLSLKRLRTLLQGYLTANQKHNQEYAAKYAVQIVQYRSDDIAAEISQSRSVDKLYVDRSMVEIYSDAGKVREGAALLEKMIDTNAAKYAGESFDHGLLNYLINDLYRGVQWRADAVRLRAKVIDMFAPEDYQHYWQYCKDTIKQQVYDLHALGRDKEASDLDTYIVQLEKKLRAEHERNRMRSL